MIAGEDCVTSAPGILAAGDIRTKQLPPGGGTAVARRGKCGDFCRKIFVRKRRLKKAAGNYYNNSRKYIKYYKQKAYRGIIGKNKNRRKIARNIKK